MRNRPKTNGSKGVSCNHDVCRVYRHYLVTEEYARYKRFLLTNLKQQKLLWRVCGNTEIVVFVCIAINYYRAVNKGFSPFSKTVPKILFLKSFSVVIFDTYPNWQTSFFFRVTAEQYGRLCGCVTITSVLTIQDNLRLKL